MRRQSPGELRELHCLSSCSQTQAERAPPSPAPLHLHPLTLFTQLLGQRALVLKINNAFLYNAGPVGEEDQHSDERGRFGGTVNRSPCSAAYDLVALCVIPLLSMLLFLHPSTGKQYLHHGIAMSIGRTCMSTA